jgi:hypothetical protein
MGENRRLGGDHPRFREMFPVERASRQWRRSTRSVALYEKLNWWEIDEAHASGAAPSGLRKFRCLETVQ